MKTRFFILGAIFAILGFSAQAQVNLMYEQGFEEDEAVTYSVTPSNGSTLTSGLYMGGSRAIKLVQAKNDDVVFVTDTIDFRQNLTLRYISLEFDHICNVDINAGTSAGRQIGLIYVKLAGQSDAQYTQLTGAQNYNVDREGYSEEFRNTATFNRYSYEDWQNDNVTNANWKSERFDINDILSSSVPAEERRLIFRFVLKKRTKTGNVTGTGWWIDNIRVRASQNQMVDPKINMVLYPDGGAHPSSRGARVVMDARTDVSQGINTDSAYLYYTVGSDLTPVRLPMAYTGNYTGHDNVTYSRFAARIPFYGYDTMMRFYCVVRDASVNANQATYPATADTWVKYWCVRGTEYAPQNVPAALAGTSTASDIPFIQFADTRHEWVIDSAFMAQAGYGPGAMTSMRFIIAGNTTAQSRPNYQFRLKNAPNSYTVPSDMDYQAYTTDYMQVVWDSTLTIGEASAGALIRIDFQDTFYYAGSDIVMQSINDGNVDPAAVSIKMVTNPNTKKTKGYWGLQATYHANAYTHTDLKKSSFIDNKRPALVMDVYKNQPLQYDAGVASLVFPNYESPIITQPSHIDVELKNFGAETLTSAVIGYSIDDSLFGSFTWNGTLAGQESVTVTVATGVTLNPGYHELRAWVGDTLTAGSLTMRDHEPYNDTSFSSFIVCAGPLNGVRNIGGENADYNTIEEFLFSLSRCGVDDSLVVRLTPGSYPPFAMPEVDGLTEQHYIVFEPAGESATIYADATTGTQYMVNLANVDNMRFRNIDFVRRGGALTNMVALGLNSANCRFEGCRFLDSVASTTASMRITSMLYSGYADNLTVRGCTFVGGGIGVDISGRAADIRSTGGVVERCYFSGQYNNAVRVQYMDNVTVEGNEMYDVQSNSSYVLLAYACYGNVRITANKIYSSHGAGGLGVSNVNGTSSNHAIVANNMIVSADDGNSNLLSTAMNIISGTWMDVVYNSVKMTAPSRSNIATATFGGGTLTNSMFVNNIVACYDGVNYAFSYAASAQPNNTLGHNIYYAEGYTLNRKGTQSYHTIEQWTAAVSADATSIVQNPTFLNGTLVDLRTFNRFVKGKGTPVATVTTDMFGTARSTTTPCPGAFEFVSLNYDFEPEALVSPDADVCGMPENVELVLRLRNSGSNVFVPNASRTMTLSYSVDGGAVSTYNVTQTLPSNDTVSIHTGRMLLLPANGLEDRSYTIRVWLSCSLDPNETNDSNTFVVTSRYRQPDATSFSQDVPYASAATVRPTTGVTEWDVYNDASAPKRRSQILWYNAPDDDEYYYRGDSVTTEVLRRDTTLYFKQRRMLPIVRITQVQMKTNTAVGLTNPMPSWIKTGNTNFAVQLTNVGDDTAHLQGDTLMTVSTSTSSLNDKRVVFGDVSIAPGEALVVQFVTGTSPAPESTLYGGTAVAPASNANFGIVYRHNGVVEDAVPFNGVIVANPTANDKWVAQDVPSYVWSGPSVKIPTANIGGIARVAFNGDSLDWRVASNDNRLFIGSMDTSWIRYKDNGCPTGAAEAHLVMLAPPSVDLALAPRPLASGCGLGMEQVSVAVSNYGVQAANNITLNYTAGDAVVSETLTTPLAAGADTVYTFLQRLNMNVARDSVFNVTVYATKYTSDNYTHNDTCLTTGTSLFQPGMPTMSSPVSVNYGEAATLTHYPGAGLAPVWYDADGNVLDTAYTHVTPLLYVNDTVKLGYLSADTSGVHIGTLAALTAKTAYPSPYQPNNKFVKQQYIYSAHDLRSMGLEPGSIKSVAFHLDSIWGSVQSVPYADYYISLGLTDDTIFANSTDWKTTQVVYHAEDFTLTRSDVHTWVNHPLQADFVWDGVSSLVVQVVYERSASITTGMQTAYTQKTATTLHKASNSALSPSTMGFVGSGGNPGANRPDIKLSAVKYGCPGPLKTIAINIIGTPAHDAKISWPSGTDGIVYNSCGNISMDVNVSNLALNLLNNYELKYSVDGAAYVSSTRTTNVAPGATVTMQLMSVPLMPGRHSITAVVVVEDDTIHTNDTIRRDFMVRFCGRTYTISTDASADYNTLTEAIDTMNIVGIDGPVVFNIAAGTYNEQIELQSVYGSSAANTITFVGHSDSTTTIINNSFTTALNYVFWVNGASNVSFRNLAITSRPPSGSNAHVLKIDNADNISLQNVLLRVKGGVNSDKASCLVLGDSVRNLSVGSSTLDSGYYSITAAGEGNRNFTIQNSTFSNFSTGALNLKNLANVDITKNSIYSSLKTKQIAVYMENADSAIYIQKNKIYLLAVPGTNDKNGRRGIDLKNVSGSSLQYAYVVNNMVSLRSEGVTGYAPAGISIDGTSSYINVYYNSVRLYAGETDVNQAKAFVATSNTNNLQVMNNIFANFGSSFAYHVASSQNITSSDFNVYYGGGAKLTYWSGTDCPTLTYLQANNGKDGSSMQTEPYFVGDDDLHLAMANLVARAQYNPDVTDDIDDSVRSVVPGPTIGAHEMSRRTRNMSIMRILEPKMPVNTNFNTTTNFPPNIETDSVLVKVEFYNNGSIPETEATWYAYIDGYESTTTSVVRSLGNMMTGDLKVDSVMVFAPMGVIDSNIIRVVLLCPNDDDTSDNALYADFFLAPAFNLKAQKVTNGASGCTLQRTQVSIELLNEGFKPIPDGIPFEIGFHSAGYHPNANNENNRLNIRTMPDTVRQTVIFDTPLPLNQPRTLVFDSMANFYPTDTSVNIKVRLKGWCHFPYDISPDNDTTGPGNSATSPSPVFDAYYSPEPPIGFDTTFDYGTWGEVRAMQVNSRPVRWYRDSTATPFYTNNNYNNSRWWRTTPQYFHDSTYYLQCLSDKNCPSFFSEVHVHVSPQIGNDIAVEEVVSPLGNRVYMENDTVRVRIANYGTNVQQNFPVTYQLRKNNNTAPLMEVTETCTQILDVGQTITFSFDSLLQFANALQAGNYFLRVWTDLASDEVRRNDTLRQVEQLRPANANQTVLDYPFHALAESTYPACSNLYGDNVSDSIDIIRVSFNEIDVDLPPLGRSYTNFGNYNNPEYPVLHVTRGTTDSIIIAIANPSNLVDRDRGRVAVYIDFNRNGSFEDPGETVVSPRAVFTDSLLRASVAIPQSASLGYMKMRVSASTYSYSLQSFTPGLWIGSKGHNIDFLLFVDPEAPAADIALSQIVSPRSTLVRDSLPTTVSLRMLNRGASAITSAHIYYRFDSDTMSAADTGDFTWTGILLPGRSTVVSLPAHRFPCGTTNLTVWHTVEGDVNPSNDTLVYEYHRFHTLFLTLEDNFDSLDYWYAPVGYNSYTRNYWQLGTPQKPNNATFTPHSAPNTWVTDLNANITSGTRGNLSYLYSPIIDISQIRPDTISFFLVRQLNNSSAVRVEYYSYRNMWEVLDDDSLTTWYNNIDNQCFDGTRSWYKYSISTNILRSNFNERMQFRFVYSTPQTAGANTNFGAGCAVDDFHIGRARQRYDVGVVAITKPVQPKFGETVYPEVVVKNFGYDTVRQIQLGYTYYGTYLARMNDYTCLIAPDEVDTFTFSAPFVVTSDFPDTFAITVFTNSSVDIYRDNDTLEKQFYLAPLGGDIAATSFVYPRDYVVGGDSIAVTMRIRNAGVSPIANARLSYTVGNTSVEEDVDIVELLGHPLATREYFNYTFLQKFRGAMGSMNLTAIAKCDSNEYLYNDTISKRIRGITAITDAAAAAIVVDTSDYNWVRIQLVVENRGARGINNFEVGFWYDNDTLNKVVETFYRDTPLEALNMTTHLFDVQLPHRSAGYRNITAYVSAPDDNDPTNDTTSEIARQFVDIEVLGLVVEENANPDCRVFMRVRNIGNLALVGKTIPLRATINGNDLSYNVVRRLDPGYSALIEFNRTIPKSPMRTYTGSGRIQNLGADVNPDNNQTTNISVVNYVEGIPSVNGANLVLGQNYPNPFSGTTTVPFTIPTASAVRLFVMDAMGKIVYTADGFFPEGDNTVTVDLADFSTGIYYYGIVVDGQRQMRKLIVK